MTVSNPTDAPTIERLAADTDPHKLADVLDNDGGFIVTGLLSATDALALAEELQPAADARRPGFRDDFDDAFYGRQTIRLQSMARRSRRWVDQVLLHPVLLGLADGLLLPNCGDYHLSQSELIYLGPGQPAQELHSDDLNWPIAARLGIPLQMSVLVCLGDYDAEVGATRIVPGSHRWAEGREPEPHEILHAEMNPGDALVYQGQLLHSGGANRTADRWRKALYLSYLLGWLTPEEAVPMAVGADLARSLPARARELLGWANLPSRKGSAGAEAALQLWSLDLDDLDASEGAFHHR